MARLPQPGGDSGQWGQLLNDYLSVSHKNDGSFKAGSVDGSALQDGSVDATKLATSSAPANDQALTFSGGSLAWATLSASGSVPDATSGTKGLVQLAGDLGGTASAPVVAAGAVTTAKLADNAVTTAKITDANVTAAKVADNAITEPKLNISNTPAASQVLSWNGSAMAWTTPSTGSSDPTVGGDLTGTASNAQIAANAVGSTELATNAVTTAKLADANVTTAKLADNAVTTAKITDANITAAKLANDAVTEPKLAATNTPTNGQLLSYNGTNFTWVAAPTGGSDPVMGGDISGSASAAAIVAGAVTTTKLADANVTTAKVADNAITEPKLNVSNSPATNQVLSWNGSAMAWATPATGGSGRSVTAPITAATYTASVGEYVVVDPTAGQVTVTLPSSAPSGAWVSILRRTAASSPNSVLIVPGSGDQIEAVAGNDLVAFTNATNNTNFSTQDYVYSSSAHLWYRVG